MASLVVFRVDGVTVEWNKGAAYSITDSNGRRTFKPDEVKAIAAAKRRARYLKKESAQ